MVLVDADRFLNELTKLYEATKESGTVWVTLKRSSLQPNGKRKSESPVDESQFRCIVRATDGKKKISTLLSAKDHQRFQTAYATVLKAHMDTLKKRDKKEKKEKKTTTATKVSGS
jgi:signal recognition particle subunit SRP14